jgi:hypothetical protein
MRFTFCQLMAAWLVAMGALSSPALAEGRCPPGFYPTGGGNAGWEGCAPMGPMEEDQDSDEDDGGGYGDGLPPMRYDPGQWKIWAENAKRMDEAREAELIKDPVYRRLKKGYWHYVKSDPGDAKQICMASFMTPRGGVLLMDWAGEQPGTFLAFFGAGIPKAAQIKRMRVSLIQSGETQTVQAFHAPLPWEKRLGMVMFAVPSTSALLGSIEDVQDFEVKAGNETLAWGKWHSGKQARAKLSQCVKRRG